MCPSMSFGDEISRNGSQNYTDFRCLRKGLAAAPGPVAEVPTTGLRVRFMG